MKIEHLRYFMSTVHAKSINQAAKDLYLSQQQLNNILTSLEHELQIVLLERSNKGVTLTEDGQEFYKYAKKILADYTDMQNHFYVRRSNFELKPHHKQGKCVLHAPSMMSVFSSDIINKFRELAPNISLQCIEETGHITNEQFDANHLYLLGHNVEEHFSNEFHKQLNVIPIGIFPCSLYVNKNTSAAKQKDISSKQLPDVISVCSVSISQSVYRPENIMLISSNIYQQLDAVEQNNGICMLPTFLFPKMSVIYPNIVTIPFREPNLFELNIIYDSTYMLTEADEILITFLKSYLHNQQLLAEQMLP